MHLVIFETEGWEALAPLTFSRPTFSLLCGATTLLEKQLRTHKPERLTLWIRPELANYCRRWIVPWIEAAGLVQRVAINTPIDQELCTLIDGRTLFLSPGRAVESPSVFIDEASAQIREAVVISPGLSYQDCLQCTDRWNALKQLPTKAASGKSAAYPWDLLGWNEEALLADAAVLPKNKNNVAGPWHLINADQIFVGQDARISLGCVIDATKGPVILAAGSFIGANAVLQGPCYVGLQSEISPLSLIRPGTSIGPQCKIGGEVARSTVLGCCNKAHEGFLGDSYLGEWINFGAGTTTSNLKNTYGNITMTTGDQAISTGRQFLGSIIGDHAKTAIGTRLMCGSYVGYSSMIATSAHALRFTPSFTFLTDRGAESYRPEKAVEVAKAVYARRRRAWTDDDASLMKYAATVAERVERRC